MALSRSPGKGLLGPPNHPFLTPFCPPFGHMAKWPPITPLIRPGIGWSPAIPPKGVFWGSKMTPFWTPFWTPSEQGSQKGPPFRRQKGSLGAPNWPKGLKRGPKRGSKKGPFWGQKHPFLTPFGLVPGRIKGVIWGCPKRACTPKYPLFDPLFDPLLGPLFRCRFDGTWDPHLAICLKRGVLDPKNDPILDPPFWVLFSPFGHLDPPTDPFCRLK